MEKGAVIFGVFMLVAFASLVTAEDLSSLCAVRLDIRHNSMAEPIAGTFYSGKGCPGSTGMSTTPVEVNPGETVCYSFTYYNDGPIEIPAKRYSAYSRAIGYETVSNDANSNRADSIFLGTEHGELPPGESITLNACGTILDYAPPVTAFVHSYVSKYNASGAHIGTFSNSWHNYPNALRTLDSPTKDYVNVTVSWSSVTWNPPAAYSSATNTLDLSQLGALAPGDTVRSRRITVRNHDSSQASFTGSVSGNGMTSVSIVLAPGEQTSVDYILPKSYFTGHPAGILGVQSCLWDSTPKFVNCDWAQVTTLSDTVAALLIEAFDTDATSYEAGDTGTLTLRLKNIGATIGASSTATLRLRNNAPAMDILSPATDALGTLAYGDTATLSHTFTIPSASPFMTDFTKCFDVDLKDNNGMAFPQVKIYTSTWASPIISTTYCDNILPTTPTGASCTPPVPAGNPPKQNCTCGARFCTIEAPPGMWISEIDFGGVGGIDYNLVDNRLLYLVGPSGIPIIVEYMKGVVPSMELGILSLALLSLAAFLMYNRGGHGGRRKKSEPDKHK